MTVAEPPPEYPPVESEDDPEAAEIISEESDEPRKFYVDGGKVEVIGHLVYDLDADGKKLKVVRYTEYSARTVRSLFPNRDELQSKWASPDTRIEVLRELAERHISFDELVASTGYQDADAFDLLCHLAWNAPLLTRRQRAEQARKQAEDLFSKYGETARDILRLLPGRYIERGVIQFNRLSDLLKVEPFDRYGTPSEIADRHFGGVPALREAVSQLQATLYQ
ncbi:MAG: type I restriction-modification enzyme R subunit C-terminal domain-containing protein [Dokdonella sp.]